MHDPVPDARRACAPPDAGGARRRGASALPHARSGRRNSRTSRRGGAPDASLTMKCADPPSPSKSPLKTTRRGPAVRLLEDLEFEAGRSCVEHDEDGRHRSDLRNGEPRALRVGDQRGDGAGGKPRDRRVRPARQDDRARARRARFRRRRRRRERSGSWRACCRPRDPGRRERWPARRPAIGSS